MNNAKALEAVKMLEMKDYANAGKAAEEAGSYRIAMVAYARAGMHSEIRRLLRAAKEGRIPDAERLYDDATAKLFSEHGLRDVEAEVYETRGINGNDESYLSRAYDIYTSAGDAQASLRTATEIKELRSLGRVRGRDELISEMEGRRSGWDLSDEAMQLSERLVHIDGPLACCFAADQYARSYHNTRNLDHADRAVAYAARGLKEGNDENTASRLNGVVLWIMDIMGEDVNKAMDSWDTSETAVKKSQRLVELDCNPENIIYAADIMARRYQQTHDDTLYNSAMYYINSGLSMASDDKTAKRLEGIRMWLDELSKQA